MDSYGDVVVLLGQVWCGLGLMLLVFEVMWVDYWYEVMVMVGVCFLLGGVYLFYVLIEVQGLFEDIDGLCFQLWIESQFEVGLIVDVVIL